MKQHSPDGERCCHCRKFYWMALKRTRQYSPKEDIEDMGIRFLLSLSVKHITAKEIKAPGGLRITKSNNYVLSYKVYNAFAWCFSGAIGRERQYSTLEKMLHLGKPHFLYRPVFFYLKKYRKRSYIF